MKPIALLSAALLLVASCSDPSNPSGFNVQALKKDVHEGNAILMSSYTSFEWERLFIFQPYIPESVIREDTGAAVEFPHRDSDGHCLLVFKKQGASTKAVEIRRNVADFAELYRKEGYSPKQAIFYVRVQSGSQDKWRYLSRE